MAISVAARNMKQIYKIECQIRTLFFRTESNRWGLQYYWQFSMYYHDPEIMWVIQLAKHNLSNPGPQV